MTFAAKVRGAHFEFAQCERTPPHDNAFTASMNRIRLIGLDT